MKKKMKIMDGSGHNEIEYDTEVEEEVQTASEEFNRMIGEHYTAFANPDGDGKREIITAFDPDAEDVLLVAQISGG